MESQLYPGSVCCCPSPSGTFDLLDKIMLQEFTLYIILAVTYCFFRLLVQMKKYCLLAFIFTSACFILVLSFYGEDSYAQLGALQNSLTWQRKHNAKLLNKVENLKEKVTGLQGDQRSLEKAARNTLGMARPDELVIIFKKKTEQK